MGVALSEPCQLQGIIQQIAIVTINHLNFGIYVDFINLRCKLPWLGLAYFAGLRNDSKGLQWRRDEGHVVFGGCIQGACCFAVESLACPLFKVVPYQEIKKSGQQNSFQCSCGNWSLSKPILFLSHLSSVQTPWC